MSRAETLHGKIDPDAKYYMYIYVLVWEDDLIPMNVGKPTRTGTSLFMAGLVKDQKKMRAAGIQPIVVGTDGDIMGERLVRLCKLHEFDVPVMSMSQAESLPGFEWGAPCRMWLSWTVEAASLREGTGISFWIGGGSFRVRCAKSRMWHRMWSKCP